MGKREAEGCGQIMLVFVYMTLWALALKAPLSMGFLGKSTGVGCPFLLQGIFATQGLNPLLLGILNYTVILYLLSHLGSPIESECCLLYQ